MKFTLVLLCAGITLAGAGCNRHRWKDGVPPQPIPYPVLSLSTEKTLAVAAMVRVAVNVVPANAVACLSIDIPRYGERFQYYPDSVLLKAVEGNVKIVSERNCPAPGDVEPYHVIATQLQYFGANQAKGTVISAVRSVHYVLPCYVRRMSRHTWRPSCGPGMYEIMGP
jgi:hypothetical protein